MQQRSRRPVIFTGPPFMGGREGFTAYFERKLVYVRIFGRRKYQKRGWGRVRVIDY
jgi:hypothetical protein